MDKTAIKKFAVWAREKLIEDISYKAGLLGISDKGIAEELPQSTNDLKFFDIGTKEYVEVSGKEIKQRDALVSAIRKKERDTKSYKEAYEFIIEEVAYTWFNRLIAIRFMEVNDYLPSGIRVLSSEDKAKKEPDFVTNPFEADLDLTPFEQEKVIQLKEQNKSDELFRMLFIKQCNKLHEILPKLFEKTDDYSELLLTISFTDKDGVLYRLTHDIGEDDFNIKKEGQIEIIGWMYQYYNIELKAAVFAKNKNDKYKKEQIPAVTQLFTPRWIVQYMVENSLGRLWYEGHNDSSIKDKWKYYIDEAKQEPEVQEKLNKIKDEYKKIKPEDIKIIDPCMGSGHILVYAFDVLMQIYESYGYTQRDAASIIIKNNIYGLDIDKRAAQLAYFAVMMKGRQYDRRFFTRNLTPKICDIPEIEEVSVDIINAFGDCVDIAKKVCDSFVQGKEFGSLIIPDVSLEEIEKLNNKLVEMYEDTTCMFSQRAIDIIRPIMDIVTILVEKYDVVITNPPYMGFRKAGVKLAKYVKKHYPDSKDDLFAVFMERCKTMVKKNRFQAMITMQSWMFLPSFEKLREKLLNQDIVNMAHLGAKAFEEIGGEVVQTVAFVLRNGIVIDYKSIFMRLVDYIGQEAKETAFLIGSDIHIRKKDIFKKIPGNPLTYWIDEKIYKIYDNPLIMNHGNSVRGLDTGGNEKFLRLWYEIMYEKVNFEADHESILNTMKWFPFSKGRGGFRKWFGHYEVIINYENSGFEMKKLTGSRIQNVPYYFREHISWSGISSKPSFRYFDSGFIFGGSALFIQSKKMLNYIIGFLNSKISSMFLESTASTLSFNAGQISTLPFIYSSEYSKVINDLVLQNIELSRLEWNSFETSWDFDIHPLVRGSYATIEDAYSNWKKECDKRFYSLKENEEELNRIFVNIYGLQDEIIPDIDDKDVTVRKADLQRDIKSLISYAVGCMFGRYSLSEEGLIYAGGEWNSEKYKEFAPDDDNCIPVTDEEYFEDDIVGRFCEFIKIVFGEEDLETNLKYIADALGNKGTTSRDVIRNYFLRDFIKDHIKIYQKRPIYWMFDSGKQNGFKALVYMHRWNANTIGNMRVEYLHRMQKVYDKEIERMQEVIDTNHEKKEVNLATKRKEKLQKQLKETKEYDTLIAHLALSRIDIDLDDGVKVNYEKVQTSKDGKVMKVLIKL